MTQRYVKTVAGREAIRSRSATLSRPARNLLLIIDDSRSGADWLALVANATEADLAQLLAAGLVLPVMGATAPTFAVSVQTHTPEPAPVPPAAITTVDVPLHSLTLDEALGALGYRALYDVLTAQARARLGLIKGYLLALDIEKCNGVDELRGLARRFVADLEATQGRAAANALRMALGAEA
jgi:hypothetical protein